MSQVCEEVSEVSAADATETKFEGSFTVVTRACARTYSGDHNNK